MYLPRPPDYGWEELSQNIGRIMDQWQVGDVKITRIAELRNVRWPNFVFRSLSADEVREQEWLLPNHATPEGQLISSTHAFVIECGSRKIIVDTCVGNDKVRKWPAWNDLQDPFCAAWKTRDIHPIPLTPFFARISTSTTLGGIRNWSTGDGCRHSRTRNIFSAAKSGSIGRRRTIRSETAT